MSTQREVENPSTCITVKQGSGCIAEVGDLLSVTYGEDRQWKKLLYSLLRKEVPKRTALFLVIGVEGHTLTVDKVRWYQRLTKRYRAQP